MKSKIRILHIISTPGLGGAQTLLSDIVKNSSNQYIYCLRKDKINTFKGLDKMFYYNSYKYYKFNPLILIDLFKTIKKNNFGILDLHLGKPLIYAYLIKIFNPNIKIIYHEHGMIFSCDDSSNRSYLYEILLKLLGNKIDLFIAVSKATKEKLIENAGIPENKIKVLYNFVDLEKFNPEVLKKYDINGQREELGIRGEDFVIGLAGRLNKVKGCEYLIKSIPYINIPNFKVLIAGDGIERKKLEKLSENLNIKDKIIFLGYVKEISNFYEIIDVLVVPSKFESFGLSAVEAQASGVPVIASNVAALNEIIKDKENGLLFKAKDEIDLAEKIKLVYSNGKLKKKLIEKGLESVKKYSLNKYLKQLNKLYNNELIL
jgi:glycosyltransferase involved in cell wall biosynthesis